MNSLYVKSKKTKTNKQQQNKTHTYTHKKEKEIRYGRHVQREGRAWELEKGDQRYKLSTIR